MKNEFPTIVITGGTKGIGKATAELFAGKGFNIVICSRNLAELKDTAAALQSLHPGISVLYQVCDVSKKADVLQFSRFVLENFSRIDILVNNAGIFIPGNIYDEADGVFENILNTNLHSAYYLTRALLGTMISQKSGHIFNVCSVASINAYDAGGTYAISKFGLLGFSKNLRHELMEKGIKVTALLVGATYTPSWEGNTELPIDRFIPATDIAKAIFNAYDTSPGTVVEEILIRPQLGDI